MKFTHEELISYSKMLILPTRPMYPFSETKLLNKAFLSWKNTWLDVQSKTDFRFKEEEFYRQNTVMVLLDPDEEVIGCHLYSYFNLESLCSRETSFFRRFDSNFVKYLEQKKIFNSFSAEYLTVCKDYRKNGSLSFARAIISLSCKFLATSHFDGLLAQTRDDVQVNKMAMEYGAKILSTDLKMNGISGSFAIVEKKNVLDGSNLSVINFVNSVWNSRLDLTSLTKNQEKIGEEAA